jgi:hypothetical protein
MPTLVGNQTDKPTHTDVDIALFHDAYEVRDLCSVEG